MLLLAPLLALLALPALTLASQHNGAGSMKLKHHRALASNSTTTGLKVQARREERVGEEQRMEKRGFEGARLTYYNVQTGNAGSCGRYLQNSDFVVAVTDSMMNSGWCGRQIRIHANGKTATASIEDTCPGCPYAALDLSEDLFSFFADHGNGVLTGSWEFADEAPQQPAPAPQPAPPPPDPTWQAPEPVTITSEAPPPPPSTTSSTTSTTSSATPTTSSIASAASFTTSSLGSSFASTSESVASDITPSTLSAANPSATAAAAPPAINNLQAIAGLTNGLGAAICNGNDKCV